MCLCCPTKICMFILCVVLVVIAIGLVFGFGVFSHGYHKVHDELHLSNTAGADSSFNLRRRFAPAPY